MIENLSNSNPASHNLPSIALTALLHGGKGMHVIDPKGVRDIGVDVLGDDGHPKIMPAAYYESTTAEERALFGVRNGVYALPTQELIAWLRGFIAGRRAIEIGAGNGIIARALDIPATDSHMQELPGVRAIYDASKQPTVTYGRHVERLSARQATRKHNPQVVIAAWVTHKYDEKRHDAGGNMFGVDERDVLQNCEHYVFIGNTQVHASKPLWGTEPMLLEHAPWLHSRAFNGSPDFIAVWKGRKHPARSAT
jgi:hypothetical protein